VTIRILPPDVAARIAAGEVVERPASVVKELVENALDAGASAITVEITDGGTGMIRVTDDGCGIGPADIDTAFQRHATSKITSDADIARVATLGFRGEALPSIAAVASVELTSRTRDREAGSFRRLEGGQVKETSTRGAPVGTSFRVDGIFSRLPARRAFLRSASAEAGAVSTVVTRYALARPEVRFRLVSDGRQSLHTPGNGVLRDAVAAVYGLEVAAALLPVLPGDGPIAVSGLAGPPHVARASRIYMNLFVNGRWIQHRRLAFAIEDAYRGLLMTGRHPVCALNIILPQEEVDVNVHPTKAEVRFRDESAVFTAVQRAVRAALVEHAPVPAGVSGGAPAAVLNIEAPAWTPPIWETAVRLESREAAPQPASLPAETAPSAPATPSQVLPVLRVIGQYGSIYIIAEGPEGMYLVDQHAAHERVLYEQFFGQRQRATPAVQGLLDPLTIDLAPRLRALLAAESESLAEHGFGLEAFGESTVVLRAVPRPLAAGDVRENVLRFFDTMLEEEGGDRGDRVAMSLACHGAIRAGKSLAPEEMRELIRQLEACETPNTCPHGRPTMVHLSGEALARGFGRR
jgi:DNA mismatch repair protein MutL